MVFEEEDFQLAMYGYRLAPDITEQRTIGMLREVETELNEMIHSSSNVSSTEVRVARTRISSQFRHFWLIPTFLILGRMGDLSEFEDAIYAFILSAIFSTKKRFGSRQQWNWRML